MYRNYSSFFGVCVGKDESWVKIRAKLTPTERKGGDFCFRLHFTFLVRSLRRKAWHLEQPFLAV